MRKEKRWKTSCREKKGRWREAVEGAGMCHRVMGGLAIHNETSGREVISVKGMWRVWWWIGFGKTLMTSHNEREEHKGSHT